MQEFRQIGELNWTYDELRKSIPEFVDLYEKRPIKNNLGGMRSPHMFATWFMLKKLAPENVVESGVWRGQGTWLIEKALPEANIFSIDLDLSRRSYVSDKVQYFSKDFSEIDWSIIRDKNNTILFFDDHVNPLYRIKQAQQNGFKQLIFEDNYPIKHGDCYSLKKAFQHAGFSPISLRHYLSIVKNNLIRSQKIKTIPANSEDSKYLKSVLEIYYEFPPVFKKETTRWNDAWEDNFYPTPEPLFLDLEDDYLKILYEEAIFYTWICYARLKLLLPQMCS